MEADAIAPLPPALFDGARRAASVVVLRDAPAGGIEVLMLRRAERPGDFRSGAAVFPGGMLEPADRAAHAHVDGWDDAGASARLGEDEGGLDYVVAAVRECFEEVGLLFAVPTGAAPGAAERAAWREGLQRGERTLAALCEALGLRLPVGDWAYLSHWLTPPGLPRRFDTRFFVARAPAGQEAEADRGEAQEVMWLSPQAALSPVVGLTLLPVTRETLRWVARFDSVAAALAAAREPAARPCIMPRRARTVRGPTVLLPWDGAYDEVARLDPEGTGEAWGDLAPGRAVRLSERVLRVTAPNPGVMTGAGTNTYLVGAPEGGGWTVIDPGPDDAAHLAAVQAAAPGPIVRILVTHTHPDHSAGAAPLARATGAPVLGRRAAHAAGQDATFDPTEALQGGEVLPLGPGATLRVLHVPGHASNHLCYLLEEEGIAFAGDHVMQGATVVIDPPDGDMAAYLASLEALAAADPAWLAPGHGFLLGRPRAVLAAVARHRRAREARVVAALARLGSATLDALAAEAYADAPPALQEMARRSLLAHLLALAADGRAVCEGERWRPAS